MRQSDTMVTLEQYRRFYDDPWCSDLSRTQLNQIIDMHGFGNLHRSPKMVILAALGTMKLMPTTRSTLKRSISCCALLTAADTAADLAELGWQEYPVRALLTLPEQDCLATSAPAPRPRYRCKEAPPAGFSVGGRRPRSKRRRVSINALLTSLPSSVASSTAATAEAGSLISPSPPPLPASSPPRTPSPPSSPIPCPPPYRHRRRHPLRHRLLHLGSDPLLLLYYTFAMALSSPTSWTQTFYVITI